MRYSDFYEVPVIIENPCLNCGAEAQVEHHVVPASRGGKVTVSLCQDCHDKAHHLKPRGNMSVSELTKAGHKRSPNVLGPVPFGYAEHYIDGKRRFLPKKDEQRTLAVIYELHDVGMSLREIARHLELAGTSSQRGGEWSHRSVSQMLERRGLDLNQEAEERAAGIQRKKRKRRDERISKVRSKVPVAPSYGRTWDDAYSSHL